MVQRHHNLVYLVAESLPKLEDQSSWDDAWSDGQRVLEEQILCTLAFSEYPLNVD